MDAERLETLLSAFVERRERGEALAPEAFAREHAGEGAELLAALRALAATEALFPSGAPDLPGRVGPYRVRGEIGRGGMGRVLEVVDPAHPERPLALKLLHVSLAHQPRALERFRREGKALERLAHPWIVRVHASGLLDDRPFLAMEKVEGTSLAELLRRARERLPPGARAPVETLELPGEGTALERAVRLVARLARAMAAAHGEGVLHRDLNPRNVLVRASGEPVLIDFGLMRASGDPTLTGSGDLLGTPQYMAPEQARAERVDERTDVFGLGAILWELLTLSAPRAADDTLALVRAAGSRPLGGIRRRFPDLPRELELVVRRATSFFRRWRFPSCEALALDLERWLAGEDVRARPPSPWQALVERVQAHRRIAAGAAALLLALCTALVALHWRGDEDREGRWIAGSTSVVLPWLDGDLPRARDALARYLEREREPPFAAFLSALATDDLARDASAPAERALLEGERARRAGRPREALQRFKTAWDLSPGYPMVVLLQGLAAFEAGELAAARGALEVSARPFGPSLRLHRTLAAVYEGLERPADAARALNAVLALAPEDAGAWLALARVRERIREEEGALAAALRAHALDPGASRAGLEELAQAWDRAGSTRLAAELRSGVAGR
jgi:serine/threonine protein kinase